MFIADLAETIIKQNRAGLIVYLVILLLSHICFGLFSSKLRFNKWITGGLYSVFVVFCVLLAKFCHNFSILFVGVFTFLIALYILTSAANPFKAAFSITSYLIFFSIFFGITFMLFFIEGPYAVAIRWTIFAIIFIVFQVVLYLYLIPKYKRVETNSKVSWILFTIGDVLYLAIMFMQVFYPFQLSKENIGGTIFFILTSVFYLFVYLIILHTFDTSILYDQEKERSKLLQEIATKDTLTSLYNKNYLATFEKDIMSHNRANENNNILITIMDIDKFKDINDRFGHLAGDEVLKNVALTIKEIFSDDCYKCFRFGGDEFVVISFNVDQDQMANLIKELKTRLKDNLNISISAGSQFVDNNNIDPIETAIKNADKSMYQDKFNTKN